MREPVEFNVGPYLYRSSPIDAMGQVHLMRRLAPILNALRAAAEKGEPALAIDPAVNALSEMPDEVVAYVINSCMASIQRQKAGDTGWAKVWNGPAQKPLFDDITGFELLSITANVIMAEVGPFYAGLASSLTAAVRA
ncbi:phage tail assembly chaperone [Bosea vaviloviae]|uniref:Bacteriophage protein n=1 Tax=Bosea vaviloviae TaxID=1526658 RepID=A0A0N1F303_9HYPH|nr:hypothetical protein [Bosea vaviloviae]KPH79321.1 hypothetical protein AE618_18620 [Bosea vaviloviae]